MALFCSSPKVILLASLSLVFLTLSNSALVNSYAFLERLHQTHTDIIMAQSANQLPPLVGSTAPPYAVIETEPSQTSSTTSPHHSIETLVVVLAVITILGVVAGVIARLCGGRHLGGSGEHDVEGWVERRCRSCIDGGVAADPPPPPLEAVKAEQPKSDEKITEEAKK